MEPLVQLARVEKRVLEDDEEQEAFLVRWAQRDFKVKLVTMELLVWQGKRVTLDYQE